MAFGLSMQCIGSLDLALEKYEHMTKKKSLMCNGGSQDESNENIISKGFSLYLLVKQANNVFGGIILMQYGFSLFFATFGIYFSTTIFKVYNKELGRINEMVLAFSMANIVTVIFMIYKIFMMQAKGQALCCHFAAIKDNLEGILMVFAKQLDSEEEKKLEVLISRFSTKSSPIRPCDVFDVNTASFVSISGIIITYLIVLLQFKLNAKPMDNPMNITLADLPTLLENKTIEDLQSLVQN